MSYYRRSYSFGELVFAALIAFGLLLVAALLYGFVVMLLWNWLMPEIFGLPTISFWQGWGLVVLAGILVKSSSSSSTRD